MLDADGRIRKRPVVRRSVHHREMQGLSNAHRECDTNPPASYPDADANTSYPDADANTSYSDADANTSYPDADANTPYPDADTNTAASNSYSEAHVDADS